MFKILFANAFIGIGLAFITSANCIAGPPPGFEALFNGKDLSGWQGLAADPPSRAELSSDELSRLQKVADNRASDHWKVNNGQLEFDGHGENLCTTKDYEDFELYVDWKIDQGSDSGIYLRGVPQVQIWDPEDKSNFEHGASKGSGGLWNNTKNPRWPLVRADKPIGEWNTFYIRLVGDRVTVKLNGILVVDNVPLENYWNKDQPLTTSGPIELQAHGTKIWFRNIYIRDLTESDKNESPPEALAIVPGERIDLFDKQSLNGLYTWLRDTKYADPHKVFSVADGMLHISGDGYGGIVTKQRYRDYHLILEYKWGEKTFGVRSERAKDSGLLIHSNGADGGCAGIWMPSIEAQIIEGGVGDFLLVEGNDDNGKPIELSIKARTKQDRDGEIVWDQNSDVKTYDRQNNKRINWYGRDEDWTDTLGFRGPIDLDSPGTAWTRLDVHCDGSKVSVYVNGVKANEAVEVNPSEGKIQIQSELAELYIRRWELWPLNNSPRPAAAD